MKPPAVYRAIAAVTAELARSGIAKNRSNEQEGWAFRGIDDVYNALSPLVAKHKLCVLPRILERQVSRRQSGGEVISHVALRVAFDYVAASDGSSHSVEIWGEGADRSDKATNKAMAAAYKYAAFQVFCIPLAGQVDGDAETLTFSDSNDRSPALEPVQGWSAWTTDIISMIAGCETAEALSRVQTAYRGELHALSTYDAIAYRRIGEAVAEAKRKFSPEASPSGGKMMPRELVATPPEPRKRAPARSEAKVNAEVADAGAAA